MGVTARKTSVILMVHCKLKTDLVEKINDVSLSLSSHIEHKINDNSTQMVTLYENFKVFLYNIFDIGDSNAHVLKIELEVLF